MKVKVLFWFADSVLGEKSLQILESRAFLTNCGLSSLTRVSSNRFWPKFDNSIFFLSHGIWRYWQCPKFRIFFYGFPEPCGRKLKEQRYTQPLYSGADLATVLFSHVVESWKCTNTSNLWLRRQNLCPHWSLESGSQLWFHATQTWHTATESD